MSNKSPTDDILPYLYVDYELEMKSGSLFDQAILPECCWQQMQDTSAVGAVSRLKLN